MNTFMILYGILILGILSSNTFRKIIYFIFMVLSLAVLGLYALAELILLLAN